MECQQQYSGKLAYPDPLTAATYSFSRNPTKIICQFSGVVKNKLIFTNAYVTMNSLIILGGDFSRNFGKIYV